MKSVKMTALPYILWTLVFVVAPLGLIVYSAFTDRTGSFTLQNLMDTSQYTAAFGRSLILASISTIICLVLAFPFAYFLSRAPKHRQVIYYLLVMLPMWMNFLLRTYAWMTLLENNGLLNQLFSHLGLGPYHMINTQGAVILGMVYDYIPFMILPLYSTMVKIDQSLIEAAQDLGCNSRKVLFRVVLPLSRSGILTGTVMVFVPAVSTFVISRLLGGGSTLLIGDLIESQFLGASYNPNLGAAISLVLMVIVLLLLSLTGVGEEEEVGDLLQ